MFRQEDACATYNGQRLNQFNVRNCQQLVESFTFYFISKSNVAGNENHFFGNLMGSNQNRSLLKQTVKIKYIRSEHTLISKFNEGKSENGIRITTYTTVNNLQPKCQRKSLTNTIFHWSKQTGIHLKHETPNYLATIDKKSSKIFLSDLNSKQEEK